MLVELRQQGVKTPKPRSSTEYFQANHLCFDRWVYDPMSHEPGIAMLWLLPDA